MSDVASPGLYSKTLGWRPDLALGVETMDAQHRHLVACAAALQSIIAVDRPLAEVVRATVALIEAARGHFGWEERLMRASGYRGYAAHKDEHDRLLNQLREVEHEVSGGRFGSCQALNLFVETWTLHHVLAADRLLAAFLAEHGLTA